MRWQFSLILALACSLGAWAQGGGGRGRGAATPAAGATTPAAPAAAQATGRGAQATAAAPAVGGGRGGGGGGGGANDFYAYETTAGSGIPIPDREPIESHGKVTIGGESVTYTVRTGFMAIRNATTGQSEAHLFYTYYTKDGADAAARPLLFDVGGAPGSAAALQEFGGIGPKRAKTSAGGLPPYGYADNPDSLLASTDLVFVDPVGTGYSRPDSPSLGPSFWTTTGDTGSLGEFVRSFLNTYDRWNSPRLLLGEDTGTGRIAGLANYLDEHAMPVNGIAILALPTTADATAGDTALFMNEFPSMVMAAWYHKKLAPALQGLTASQIADQAREFAGREYLHALYKGDRMTAEERAKVIADMARLTGLAPEVIVNNDLRVSPDRFAAELLRDQHETLAMSDDRVATFAAGGGGRGGGGGGGGFGGGGGGAAALDAAEERRTEGIEPSYAVYLQKELNFTSNGMFYLLNGGVGAFTAPANDDANLTGALSRNPRLQVFVGVNYFDLSLPFYETEYTLAHLNLSPDTRAHNLTVGHYETGQAAYSDPQATSKLHADLAKFVLTATTPADR